MVKMIRHFFIKAHSKSKNSSQNLTMDQILVLNTECIHIIVKAFDQQSRNDSFESYLFALEKLLCVIFNDSQILLLQSFLELKEILKDQIINITLIIGFNDRSNKTRIKTCFYIQRHFHRHYLLELNSMTQSWESIIAACPFSTLNKYQYFFFCKVLPLCVFLNELSSLN